MMSRTRLLSKTAEVFRFSLADTFWAPMVTSAKESMPEAIWSNVARFLQH